MWKKKIILCFLMLLVCTQLSGCVLTDLWGSVATVKSEMGIFGDKVKGKTIRDTIAEDNTLAMSQSTKKMQGKVNFWQGAVNFFNKVEHNSPWIAKGAVHLAGNAARSGLSWRENSYENAKAADPTYQQSKKRMEEKEANERNEKIRSYLPFVIAALIAIVVILLLVLKIKKPKKVKEEPTPAPLLPQPPAEVNASLVGRSDEKSIAQCKKYCKKFDIDYESSLQKYAGGDPKKFLDFLIGSVKEDFHPKG